MLSDAVKEVERAAEVAKLDVLEGKLEKEYESGDLTSAQRMSALSEIRKVIWLRSVLNGLVEVGGDNGREG